jgi:hypothetical protein
MCTCACNQIHHQHMQLLCSDNRKATFLLQLPKWCQVHATAQGLCHFETKCANLRIKSRRQHTPPKRSPSVVTIMAVPPSAPAPSSSSSGTAATAALLRLMRPVTAAAPVAAPCFLISVMQPSMDDPAGAAACMAGVIREAAAVLPLCRVTLGWMDSGEPAQVWNMV